MSDISIRLATAEDLADINSIYNYYVLHSTCTYQTEPSTEQERAEWFAAHGADYPVIVGLREEKVVAWGSVSPFHRRAAYRPTVENSVYVHHELLGQGIGRSLLSDLIQRATAKGFHSMMALISADQTASVKLHERLGFDKVAHLRQVGRKFNRWLDVVYMQRMLEAA